MTLTESTHQPSLRIGKYEILDHLNQLLNMVRSSSMSDEHKERFSLEMKRTKVLLNNL